MDFASLGSFDAIYPATSSLKLVHLTLHNEIKPKDKEKIISACIKLEFGDDKSSYMGSHLIKTLVHKMPLGLGTVYLYEAVPNFMSRCRFKGNLL